MFRGAVVFRVVPPAASPAASWHSNIPTPLPKTAYASFSAASLHLLFSCPAASHSFLAAFLQLPSSFPAAFLSSSVQPPLASMQLLSNFSSARSRCRCSWHSQHHTWQLVQGTPAPSPPTLPGPQPPLLTSKKSLSMLLGTPTTTHGSSSRAHQWAKSTVFCGWVRRQVQALDNGLP